MTYFEKLSDYFLRLKTFNFACYEQDGLREEWYMKAKRAIVFLFHGFFNRNLTARAASLTFYTFTSIVPIMALLLSVVPVLGVDETLMLSIQKLFPFLGDTITAIWGVISRYGSNTGGSPLLTLVPLGMMLWCLYSLFYNVVHSLNEIWGAEDRSIFDRLSFYGLTLLTVVILMSIVTPILAYNPDVLEWSLYVIVFLSVLFVYQFAPNSATSWLSSLAAALFFIVTFYLMNCAYMYLCDLIKESYVRNYGKTFYIVFLLFTWLQFIWVFFLMGAMLGCALKNQTRYILTNKIERLSPNYRQYLTVALATHIHKVFDATGEAVDSAVDLESLKIPYSLSYQIMRELKAKKVIVQMVDGRWRPNKYDLSFGELMRLLSAGEDHLYSAAESQGEEVSESLTEYWKTYAEECGKIHDSFADKCLKDMNVPPVK